MKCFSISFLLVIVLSSCKSDFSEKNYLTLKGESIPIENVIRRINLDKENAIKWADSICNNKIYVRKSYAPIGYTGTIDWSVNPYNDISWTFYFQSLSMVGFLARAYEFNPKKEYLAKGIEIMHSWKDQHITKDSLVYTNENAWLDHAVANRNLNIFHFYSVAFDQLESDMILIIEELLYENSKWLSVDENYGRSNHAIAHNRALLLICFNFDFPQKESWQNISTERMKEIFDEDVTSEGVCIENSCYYHTLVMKLLRDIIAQYEQYDTVVPKSFHDHLFKMKQFLTYMVKPNNTLPSIGDSNYSTSRLKFGKAYSSDTLNFVDSRGEIGSEPSQIDVVYPESGYAIFREYWGTKDSFINATHFMLTTANLSNIHKHSDILSFELYSNGEELIVDSGHNGYKRGEMRSYLQSTLAHNTLSVDDKHFNCRTIPKSISKINDFRLTNYSAFVDCTYWPYNKNKKKELQFQRTAYYLKPNIIILHDRVSDIGSESKFQQMFNFGKNLTGFEKDGNLLTAQFKNTSLKIKQVDLEDQFNIYEGENTLRGLIANGSKKTRKSKQIEYIKHIDSTSESLITILAIQKKSTPNSKANEIELEDLYIEKVNEKIEVYLKNKLVNF